MKTYLCSPRIIQKAMFGLCLLLFALPVFAQELKPVLTVKLASPDTLVRVAEKIAELAGATEETNAVLDQYKNHAGLNSKGPIWFILQSDGDELRDPILCLPVEDFDKLDIPGLEMLTASLKDEGDGRYSFNSPFGLYDVVKKTGCYVLTQQESAAKLPDDPNQLVAELNKYVLAIKIDLENTSLESIENFLSPFMMLAALQNPDAANSLENVNDQIEQLHNECASFTLGLAFDPKTADLNIDTVMVPRKGSATEKQIEESKNAKTIFDGFRMNGNNVVFSFGSVEVFNETGIETAREGLDTFLDGILEQTEENAETEAEYELAETAVESIKKIFDATAKQGRCDFAASLNSDALFLAAATVGDTEELEDLIEMLVDRFKQQVGEEKTDELLEKYQKKDITTIEGFNVSSFVIPLNEVDGAENCPLPLKDKTLAVYRAVKKDQAIAFACGLDQAKTEKAFSEALAATKTPAAVQAPQAVLSLQPIGNLLKRFDVDQIDETAEKVVGILTAAGSDAKISIETNNGEQALTAKIKIGGKAVSAIAELIKLFATGESAGSLDRKTIRNF